MRLMGRRYWIFDLDGTLTLPIHDFGAIRRMLGLPAERGILESLASLPPERSAVLRERLDAHEHELARSATVAAGAEALLADLRARGVTLGIFTQNNTRNVDTTLAATGLTEYFDPDDVSSRDHAPPKPRPDGIIRLLERWGADPSTAVMVGNHPIDSQAGRAAGAATVHVGLATPSCACADLEVRSLTELLTHPAPNGAPKTR